MKAIDIVGMRVRVKGTYGMGMLPFLISLFFELAVCPVFGQANNGIRAQVREDRLYLEVGREILGHPLLLVRHGMGQQQVVWQRQGDHLILKVPRINSLAGTILPVNQDFKIEALVLARFPIVSETADDLGTIVDATELFLSAHIPWYKDFVEETPVPGEGFIEKVGYLEGETIIQTRRTVSRNGNRKTVLVDFSFFRLPDPMQPRLFDRRMGYFVEDIKQGTAPLGSIARWRLEKRNVHKIVSDPVRPIVFYFDTMVPEKWKPYIKAGILEWSPAFEAAGFSNAIQVRNLPKDTLDVYRNSMNYSLIRWENYAGIRGAEVKRGSTADTYIDHRTGEILKADIILATSYENLSDEYFVRCAPLDKRTWQYPFPDGLLGELIQFVTAHETGHALGLRDGNYGEFAYPFERMREAEWLRRMGHTPSIMTYARHNYIAQPEDSIPPHLLIQKVGPMDHHQIRWGYTVLGPDGERPKLEQWIKEQDTVPWYRYNPGYYKTIGPGTGNEVVDNDDPIQNAVLGLKNMERVLVLLPKVNGDQRDDLFLERLYGKTVELWYHEMSNVLSLVGGYGVQLKSGIQQGGVYGPIPKERQMEAIQFLMANVFKVPDWLATPKFLDRLSFSTNDDVVLEKQLTLLSDLVEPFRMKRLERMEPTVDVGLTMQLMEKFQNGLFGELEGKVVHIGLRRQKLQRAYVKLLVRALMEERRYDRPSARENTYLYSDVSKSVFLDRLLALHKEMEKAMKRAVDGSTKGHLLLCQQEMGRVMP
ncbi:zinc-dependent metalloprotease [Flagellimonas beolgyonensis]|uniref:zinc-dependent metalloprotease n=1 Tax=Flagellimonas beolgyonensis TaxID=864064 RepID=UPI000F8C71FA|nr:zinc-dependent metalloprotease [Allomuricauda beolgyonensis]